MFVRSISILVFGAILALPMAAFANLLCVSVDRANLRAGPGSNHKVTWIVGKYMPLKHIANRGIWLKVQDLDGEEHWINGTMVSTSLQCAVVKTKFANLRRGPSSSSEMHEIPVADRYTPFKRLAREGAWIQLEDDYKVKYWVSDANMWWPVKRSSVKF